MTFKITLETDASRVGKKMGKERRYIPRWRVIYGSACTMAAFRSSSAAVDIAKSVERRVV